MSEYQPRRIFKQPLGGAKDVEVTSTAPDRATDNSKSGTDQLLTGQRQFENDDAFVPTSPTSAASESIDETLAEIDLTQVIRPSPRRRWFASFITISFSGLLVWQVVDTVITAYTSGDWLALGWTALITLLAGAGVGQLTREFWTLRRLKRHFSCQATAEMLIRDNRVGQAKPFCYELIRRAAMVLDKQSVLQWEQHLNDAYNDAEVLELFDAYVLKTVDEKAVQLISKTATESAVLVAVSPLAITDMLLVAWRNLSMIHRLSSLYGLRLGYWARIRLLRSVFVNMAMAGASELIIDTGADLLSAGVIAKLSARAGQGLGIGILTARLGLQAVTLLRPLPWGAEKKVRLTSVTKQIAAKILERFEAS
jgi:putative membrane protein